MNLRLSRVAKERLAPHGNLVASIGTALGSAYHFLKGDPRMGTDLANISVLTFKTWLLPYVEEGKNINYLSIVWNVLDSILMEGASQVWGSPIYRGTHTITIGEILANLSELYLKRNSRTHSTEESSSLSKTNYTNAPEKPGEIKPESFMSRLYSFRIL